MRFWQSADSETGECADISLLFKEAAWFVTFSVYPYIVRAMRRYEHVARTEMRNTSNFRDLGVELGVSWIDVLKARYCERE